MGVVDSFCKCYLAFKMQKFCHLFCWAFGKVANYSPVDYEWAKKYMRSSTVGSNLQIQPHVLKISCEGPREN